MMRRLITLLLADGLSLVASICPSGYRWYVPITINATKVGTGTQSNFPNLICFNGSSTPCNNAGLVLTDLKVVASGGKIQHTVTGTVPYSHTIAADLVFTDGATVLAAEQEKYVPSTGELSAWVAQTVQSTGDTVIYACYDNAGITTDQTTPGLVWSPSSYALVAHLPDGTTLSANDSSSNANSGTISGTSAGTGMVDGGASFAAGNSIDFGNDASLSPANITVSVWTTFTGSDGHYHNLVSKHLPSGADPNIGGYSLWRTNDDSRAYRFDIGGGSGGLEAFAYANASAGGWHHVVGTFDGSNVQIYLDGVLQSTTAFAHPVSYTSTHSLTLGVDPTNSVQDYTGSMDEVRISSQALSGARILTSYNNMSSPQTYLSIGSPTSLSVGVSGGAQVVIFQ